MPKNEIDPDDPMELNGVALMTDQDTQEAMAECFITDFMRLGFDHRRIFGLFHNPFYIGMHMVLENRGENFVREMIERTFAQWGRPVSWKCETGAGGRS